MAMNQAASELLGCMSMYTDFGESDGRDSSYRHGLGAATISGLLCGDSSAALAIANWQGLSKLKHIKLGELWIQEKIQKGLQKVQEKHEENVANFSQKVKEKQSEVQQGIQKAEEKRRESLDLRCGRRKFCHPKRRLN